MFNTKTYQFSVRFYLITKYKKLKKIISIFVAQKNSILYFYRKLINILLIKI